MPSITTRLRDSADAVGDHGLWSYAAIPALTTLFHVENVGKVLAADGINVGLRFALPIPISDGWKFVSTSFGDGMQVAGPRSTVGVGVFAVGLVLQGILAAGYLGGVRARLRGSDRSFGESVRRYFVPFFGFGLLLTLLFVPPVLFALAGTPLSLLVPGWLLVFFAISYLVYAAPYLVVVEECGLVSALTRSVSLATGSDAYLRFALGYAGVVAVASLPATAVVANTGVLGVVVAIAILAPLGLVFDLATLQFVADVVEAERSSSHENREPEAGDDAGES